EHPEMQPASSTNSKFSYSNVKSSIGQLLFFTGLTSVIFERLLKTLGGSIEVSLQALPLEDHLLMVLMKLRMGLSNADLAYRFHISVMSVVLKPLIKWPNKGALLKNINLTARAQTWSNYKHNNTLKYLIAITPAGAISFLSPGWGGRVSDKQIIKESGFLELLEPMDEVLADRGFLIRDELAAIEVDTSRQLSRVRIHVERVIGRRTNFKILQTVIPVSQVDMLDDVVIVCAALTNLCKSVVPKGRVSK
uniref:DDE Tnp4 domain-containing protein n=1 Tax=Dicentrarchus labrax TaxID=13489 RepID=A0A8C4HYR8_DICLA